MGNLFDIFILCQLVWLIDGIVHTVSISHVNTIDKEGKGNVYNKHQPHTVKNFLVQHGGTLLH